MKDNKSGPWQKSGSNPVPPSDKTPGNSQKQPQGKGGCGCPPTHGSNHKHGDTYNKPGNKPGYDRNEE